MKFAVALLIAAVRAEDKKKDDAAAKGAKAGEFCDAGATDKGCAEGLRCHLGVAASNATAAAAKLTKDSCTKKGLGRLGWTSHTTASCEFTAAAVIDFKADPNGKA